MSRIYWADGGGLDQIQRSSLNGSTVETLYSTGLVNPVGIALDVAGGKMYWSDSTNGTVQRADLDGSNVENTAVMYGGAFGIALNPAAGRLYFADIDSERIMVMDMAGTNQNQAVLVNTGSGSEPWGIALDVAGGKIYWTDWANGGIRRANLSDGSNVENLVNTPTSNPMGIALDLSGGKMYWGDETLQSIQRADLDGTNVETLISSVNSVGIALDVPLGKMYFTDATTGRIGRSNLDGTGVEYLVSGLSEPNMLALDLQADRLGPPTQVPTLTHWGMILFAMVMASAAITVISRKRKNEL